MKLRVALAVVLPREVPIARDRGVTSRCVQGVAQRLHDLRQPAARARDHAVRPAPKGTYGCTSDPSVWSHTSTGGGILTNTGSCTDWSSTSAWTNICQIGGTGVCAKTASLYCIQQ